jgi:biopolymer transport protein ExbD
MFKVGTIIRLIDVVMIVLFGFLSITDITNKSQIKLPSNLGGAQKEVEQQVVFLSIMDNQRFELIDEQNTTKEVMGLDELEEFIVRLDNDYRKKHRQMILVIEPAIETMIQTTVNVMDICEKHQILKNLSYPQIELVNN